MYEQYLSLVGRIGISVQLHRVSAVTRSANGLQRTNTTVTTNHLAIVRHFKATEMAGATQEGRKQVMLPAERMTFVPERGNFMTIRGDRFVIDAVETFYKSDKPIMHRLVVTGVNNGS
jgi:hypothetical protein